MTVPSRNVCNSTTSLNVGADDDVLENLVQGVARVQPAIGVGWPIVEKKRVGLGPMLRLPVVEVIGALFDVLLPLLRQRSRAKSVVLVS